MTNKITWSTKVSELLDMTAEEIEDVLNQGSEVSGDAYSDVWDWIGSATHANSVLNEAEDYTLLEAKEIFEA